MKNSAHKIFVVEDNEWYRKLLVHLLSLNPDYEVSAYSEGKSLLKDLEQESPFLITMDYRLPGIEGEDLLRKIKDQHPNTIVIVISEQEDIETAVSLLKLGAFDYIVKGNDIRNRLLNTISNASKQVQLIEKIEKLEQEVRTKFDFNQTILGNSSKMQAVYQLLQKAITNNITVTIYGETGTGKEVVAKAIHYNSTYKDKPFVALNVAAIPKELFESELFGHEKGAFTGANQLRKGKFEEANGGTLFLDEIAELDITLQAKLLRALQEREASRVGSNLVYKFNCRILVATHRNLLQEVKAGRFREDLYFRLFGLPIELPPLRERDRDILLLSTYFIERFCAENNMPNKKISSAAQNKLMAYSWPGNVRELKSVIELACVLSSSEQIEAADVVLASSDMLASILSEEMSLREYNLKIVQLYLDKYDNNMKLVAEKLDIGLTTIYRMLKEIE
jgi:DNA-binding NtrC family response regulator